MKTDFDLEVLHSDWDARYYKPHLIQTYSPSTSDLSALGVGVEVSQANDLDNSGGYFEPSIPRPPNPSRGGEVGGTGMLGWSEGIAPDRSMHQRFTGKVLRVGNMGAHPVYGPVGFSNRQGKLTSAIESQYTEYVSTPEEVGRMLIDPTDSDNTISREFELGHAS